MKFLHAHVRWCVVALLFVTAVVSYLDRMVLSVLAPTLRSSLGFGDVEYSYVVSSFLAAYAIGLTFCGRLIDRYGVKLMIICALAFWSFSGAIHAVATGWLSLVVFRILLGVGESFNSPAAGKTVAEWIPRRERGLCMAIASNGNMVGAVIAPPLVAGITLLLGWRWAFVVTGGIGLVVCWVWRRFYHSPDAHPALTEPERALILSDRKAPMASERVVPRPSVLALFSNRTCRGFFLARLLIDPISYFFIFWLPSYLQQERHFSIALIGIVGWLPFLASDVGGPGGGALSDWLVRRGLAPQRARLSLMFLAACCMPAAIIAALTPWAWVSVVCIALVLGAQSCWMANQLTYMSESVPRGHVASMLALSTLGGSLGGIAANLMAGRLIHSIGYLPVFCILAFCHLLAWLVLYFTTRQGSSNESVDSSARGSFRAPSSTGLP